MAKNYISNSRESSRMFTNNLFESLSKVHYSVPLFIFIPVIGYFTWKALFQGEMNFLLYIAYFVGGLFIWTLTEYVMHRFVFHFTPRGKFMERIHFIFHGVHHDYPNDANRLVMPPSASIPMALGFYFLFDWLLPHNMVYPFFSGFILGYLFYDMVHYALHHANFKNGFWKRLKHHHMLHHYSDATKGYGVSWTFWDNIFQSNFDKK